MSSPHAPSGGPQPAQRYYDEKLSDVKGHLNSSTLIFGILGEKGPQDFASGARGCCRDESQMRERDKNLKK